MSEPLRITCNNIAEIPCVGELCQLATRGEQHVVLQFPLKTLKEDFDKSIVIQKLASQLPPHYRVFDSGEKKDTTHITVMRVIETETIVQYAESFMEAIERFLMLADELLVKLADKLMISVKELEPARTSGQLPWEPGELEQNWRYYFHGCECRFQHNITGQIVDITLRYPKNRYARLDPYFLAKYLYSTPEERELAVLIQDEFHDTLTVLNVLLERGYLSESS